MVLPMSNCRQVSRVGAKEPDSSIKYLKIRRNRALLVSKSTDIAVNQPRILPEIDQNFLESHVFFLDQIHAFDWRFLGVFLGLDILSFGLEDFTVLGSWGPANWPGFQI